MQILNYFAICIDVQQIISLSVEAYEFSNFSHESNLSGKFSCFPLARFFLFSIMNNFFVINLLLIHVMRFYHRDLHHHTQANIADLWWKNEYFRLFASKLLEQLFPLLSSTCHVFCQVWWASCKLIWDKKLQQNVSKKWKMIKLKWFTWRKFYCW